MKVWRPTSSLHLDHRPGQKRENGHGHHVDQQLSWVGRPDAAGSSFSLDLFEKRIQIGKMVVLTQSGNEPIRVSRDFVNHKSDHGIKRNPKDTVKQCVLGFEIVVKEPFVDMGSIGNFLHSRAVKALLLENVARCLQDS